MNKKLAPFVTRFQEKLPDHQYQGVYNGSTQKVDGLELGAGGGETYTTVETGTGGHNDTDQETRTDS